MRFESRASLSTFQTHRPHQNRNMGTWRKPSQINIHTESPQNACGENLQVPTANAQARPRAACLARCTGCATSTTLPKHKHTATPTHKHCLPDWIGTHTRHTVFQQSATKPREFGPVQLAAGLTWGQQRQFRTGSANDHNLLGLWSPCNCARQTNPLPKMATHHVHPQTAAPPLRNSPHPHHPCAGADNAHSHRD